MGVGGWIWSKIRYVGTRIGVEWVGNARFVREGPKCFYYGVGRATFGGKRASGWGKLGLRDVKGGR